MAGGSANVHCVLGRESANLIGLEGVARGSTDVHCVLGRQTANLIDLEGVVKGSANVPCVLVRESANLNGLQGAAMVICTELGARYNDMERVNHLGTDRVRVGGAELE